MEKRHYIHLDGAGLRDGVDLARQSHYSRRRRASIRAGVMIIAAVALIIAAVALICLVSV